MNQLNQLLRFDLIARSIVIILFLYLFVKFILPRLYFIYHYISISDKTLPSHPIWGHLRLIINKFPNPNYRLTEATENFYNLIVKLNEYKKGVNVIWLSWYPLVIITGHEAVEIVVNKQNLSKPWFYKFFNMREGLITSKPDKWRVRRKKVEPFFITKKLRKFLPSMDYEMNELANELNSKADKEVDVESFVPTKVYNIINKVVWGMRDNDFHEHNKESIKTIDRGSNILMQRFFNPFLWFDIIGQFFSAGREQQRLTNFVDYSLAEYLARSRQYKIENPVHDKIDYDLLDTLCSQGVDDAGIEEETLTSIIAGHETTATSIQWLLFNLGNNQEIQEKLYQEIISLFPPGTSVDDMEKINECVYLDQCVKESLRLHPSVPMFWRYLDEDTVVNGVKILKGTIVTVSAVGTHLDEKVYPNPTKYDPDRWSPENAKNIPKSSFIAFGYGPRVCIGYRYAIYEIKISIIHVIRNLKIGSIVKPEEIGFRAEVSLKPTKPLKMVFTRR